MKLNLDNFRTTVIDGKPLTLLPLVVGRRVHCILYAGDTGTITAIHGTPSPQNVQIFGGGGMVMGGSAHVDVAFDNRGLSRMVPEAIVYGVQWRIIDEIRSAEQVAEALARCEAFKEAANESATKAQTAREARKAETIPQYGHLERVQPNEYASAKQGARNIRIELKAAFPGVKFSVRSDVFSGGDSIDISWELGPTTKEVEAITGKYQEGNFNGMEDIYETNRENVFPELFGGAKYVHASRGDGEAWSALCAAFCVFFEVTPPADGKSYWNLGASHGTMAGEVTRAARELLSCTSLPVGASNFGAEHMPKGEENKAAGPCGFARYYRMTYTAPEAPTPQAAPEPVQAVTTTGAVTVTENKEKGGVEIRFASKPAASVLSTLKANGWRWSRFGVCWYNRASDAARAFAQTIASQFSQAL